MRKCRQPEERRTWRLFLIRESDTFVSYSRNDLEFASRLALDLNNAGVAIWMDKLDIQPGQLWERAVEEAVHNCSRIVVILSPASVESETVMAEVAFGLDEKKEIVPILYRDCRIPLRLRPIQYVDFRNDQDYSSALGELLRTVGLAKAPADVTLSMDATGKEGKPHVAHTPTRRIRRLYPFWMKAGIVVSVLVTAGWLSYSIFSRDRASARQRMTAEEVTSHAPAHATALQDGAGEGTTRQKEAARESVAQYPATTPESGWAVGLGGLILHTEDGGITWSPQKSGTTENLEFVTFVTPQIGWVVGGEVLLHTEDGGANWTDQSATPKQYLASTYKHYLNSMVFPTPRFGWITGGDGITLHTEDGGGHWIKQDSDTGETLYCAFFVNQESGWIVGSAGTVLHTNNGGQNWNPQNGGTEHTLYSASFPTPTAGWAVGRNGTIVHTEDAGLNWKAQESGTEAELISVAFPSPTAGWAVGKTGTIVHTANGGANWKPQSSGIAVDLNSVWFAGPLWGWAAGRRGALLHTEDGGANWKLLQPTANPNLILNAVTFLRPGGFKK